MFESGGIILHSQSLCALCKEHHHQTMCLRLALPLSDSVCFTSRHWAPGYWLYRHSHKALDGDWSNLTFNMTSSLPLWVLLSQTTQNVPLSKGKMLLFFYRGWYYQTVMCRCCPKPCRSTSCEMRNQHYLWEKDIWRNVCISLDGLSCVSAFSVWTNF